MREIESLTKFLARAVFHLDVTEDEIIDEYGFINGEDLTWRMLMTKINVGKITEAEQFIIEKTCNDTKFQYLRIAIDFYAELDKLDDSFLQEHKYPRENILKGLNKIKEIYNYGES
jgi:hypothetical protein